MSDKKMAIIELGGKQHVVAAGSKIVVNRVDGKDGDVVKAADLLTNSQVELRIIKHSLGQKINGLKFKNKVRYLKRYGHRQKQTILEVVASSEATEKENDKGSSRKDQSPKSERVARAKSTSKVEKTTKQ